MKKVLISFFVFFSLISAHDSNLVSLGTRYGGWTVPKSILNKGAVCYCVGAGEDISFDVALAEKFKCEVYIIDPTPRAIEHFEYLKKSVKEKKIAYINHSSVDVYNLSKNSFKRLYFLPIGLWKTDTVQKFYYPKNLEHVSCSLTNIQETKSFFLAECKKLSSLMKDLNHTKLDLLKLDIEGAEYGVLDVIIEENIDIKCLCIEFDELRMSQKKGKEILSEAYRKFISYKEKLAKMGYEEVFSHQDNITFLKNV